MQNIFHYDLYMQIFIYLYVLQAILEISLFARILSSFERADSLPF